MIVRSFILFLLLSAQVFGQTTMLQGNVIDAISREPIIGANIILPELQKTTMTDGEGNWSIPVNPGLYNVEVRHISYQNLQLFEQRARIGRIDFIDIELFPENKELNELVISSPKIRRSAEYGTSIKTIEIDEIQRMPGAVMDISKVIRNFPGVSPRVSFGYNIIVRGGGSYENRFFLDGIEIPAITHFNVQGLSGGPNGAINTDLIARANFRTAAFPVNRANALSSVLELEQKPGRRDRFGTKLTLGAAEYGAHIEGPMGKNSSYILSARKSYTEHLLKAFNLPVLPAFSDFQYKHKIWLPNKDQISIIGLATFDEYRLNLEGEATDALLYNVGFIPEGDQNTAVGGINYTHFTDKGSYEFVVSHNRLYNKADKFYENSGLEEDRSLSYLSIDNETKFRVENKVYNPKSKLNYGISYDLVDFTLDQYSIFANKTTVDTLDFESEINFQKYGLFLSYAYDFNAHWNIFIGARMDGNTFGAKMQNPFRQFSPRASIQYRFNDKWSATLQSGRYYQLPANVLLSYKENDVLVNQDELQYMESTQISFGVDYDMTSYRKLNFDLFYKNYDQYPFLLRDSISYANANGEYVAVGNQAANSSSFGMAYGMEIFLSQRLHNNWFYNSSISYVVSKFNDKKDDLISSAWDNRVFFNLVLGRELKKNWTVGLKFTYSGTNPYTPYDEERSSLINVWDINQRGVFNYDQLNQARLPAYHALDFRVDKKWYLNKLTIIAFLDLQNLYNNRFQLVPYLTAILDEENNPIVSETDPNRYQIATINSDTGRVLPTIGFSVEF